MHAKDLAARRAGWALDAEDAADTARAAEGLRDTLDETLAELPYPDGALASRRAPDVSPNEAGDDYVHLLLSRSHRNRLDGLACTLLELPQDPAVFAASDELARLVARWDTGFRAPPGPVRGLP